MKNCVYCDEEIVGKRSDAKYCSDSCRGAEEKRRYRERKGLAVKPQRGPYDGRSSNQLAHRMMYKFGITVEQYDQLLEKQNHCCAMCEKHVSTMDKRLAVDHNHKTGEIRGLLCGYCNHRVIGNHTDGAKLRKMADYVDGGTGWFVPENMKTGRRRRRKKK